MTKAGRLETERRVFDIYSFWFGIERWNGFGSKGEWLDLVPGGYDVKRDRIASLEYRRSMLPSWGLSPEEMGRQEELMQAALERAKTEPEKPCYDIAVMTAQPGSC